MSSKKHWFKSKNYGYGWFPSTWQGWTVLVVFLAIVIFGTLLIFGGEPETTNEVILFTVWVLFSAAVLVLISYKKGEKPSWRWAGKEIGKKHDKK